MAAPHLSFRLATVDDIPAIIAVVNAAFSVESFLEGTRTDDERMRQSMRDGQLLVAENESGQIVGSVYIELHGERGYLGMLAVAPSLQGAGLGRRVMEAGENFCRDHGCDYVDIKVLSLRPELPPIYRRWGYAETGDEEFHPSRPLKSGQQCHCIIMRKALRPAS